MRDVGAHDVQSVGQLALRALRVTDLAASTELAAFRRQLEREQYELEPLTRLSVELLRARDPGSGARLRAANAYGRI